MLSVEVIGIEIISWVQNIVAHRYGIVDHAITWDVAGHDIPLLNTHCENLLRQDHSPKE